MSAMNLMPAPELDERFGTALANEIRGSIHRTGECNSCARPLGGHYVSFNIVPLSMLSSTDGHENDIEMVSVTVRHTNCAPNTAIASISDLGIPTWDASLVGVPTLMGNRQVTMPVLFVNPTVDQHVLVAHHGEFPASLLDQLRQANFTDVGRMKIGSHDAKETVGKVTLRDDEHLVRVTTRAGVWDLPNSPETVEILSMIREVDGLIVAASYRWDASDLSDQKTVQGFLSGPHTVQGWAALEPENEDG